MSSLVFSDNTIDSTTSTTPTTDTSTDSQAPTLTTDTSSSPTGTSSTGVSHASNEEKVSVEDHWIEVSCIEWIFVTLLFAQHTSQLISYSVVMSLYYCSLTKLFCCKYIKSQLAEFILLSLVSNV